MSIQFAVPAGLNAVGAGQPTGAGKSSKNRTFVLGPGGLNGDKVEVQGSTDNGVSFQPLIDKATGQVIVLTPTILASSGPEAVIDDYCGDYRMKRTGVAVGSTLNRVDLDLEASETPTPGDLDTLALGDFPAGGAIGTAAATVDQFSAFTINQTTAGQTLTPPPPTDPTPTRAPYYFQNIGSVGFDFLGQFVLAGSTLEAAWNGGAWIPIGAGVSDGSSIQIGTNGGATGVMISAGSRDIVANADNGGALQGFTDTGAIEFDSTGGDIKIGATSATAKAVTIGSVTGAAATTIRSGTGGIAIGTNAVAMPITIGNGIGGTSLNFEAGTGGINVGTNAVAHTVRVGSTTGAAATTIQAGTGALSIIRNGNTWVWPSALGAAGSQLTDAAGNGVLSWA